MATTDRHGFQLWSTGFTQSDIILNDLLLKLETKVGLSIKDRNLTAPPGGESDGDCYIMPSGTLTGAWSGFSEHDIAILRSGTWYAHTPIAGWPAWVEDESVGILFNGSSWIIVSKDLPLDNLSATTDPGVGDDDGDGYSVGSRWINVTADKAFLCLDASTGAAVWLEIPNAAAVTANTTNIASIIHTLHVETPAETDYVLTFDAPFAGTITTLRAKTESGTCTVTGAINGTPLGGTACSAASTADEQAHASANAYSKGDEIKITVSSNSSAADLEVTFYGTRTDL